MTPDERARVTKRRLLVTGTLLFGLVLVAALFLFLYPIQTWSGQRDELGQEQRRLALLQRENTRLEDESAKLKTDAEIERLARERFDLVRPGEQAYSILPSTTLPAPSSSGGPSVRPADPPADGR